MAATKFFLFVWLFALIAAGVYLLVEPEQVASIATTSLPNFLDEALSPVTDNFEEYFLYLGIGLIVQGCWLLIALCCKFTPMLKITVALTILQLLVFMTVAGIFIYYNVTGTGEDSQAEMFPWLYDAVETYLVSESEDMPNSRNLRVLCDASLGAQTIFDDYANEFADLAISECPQNVDDIETALNGSDCFGEIVTPCFDGVVNYMNGSLFYVGIAFGVVSFILIAVIVFLCKEVKAVKKVKAAERYANNREKRRTEAKIAAQKSDATRASKVVATPAPVAPAQPIPAAPQFYAQAAQQQVVYHQQPVQYVQHPAQQQVVYQQQQVQQIHPTYRV